jgi:hypothetical protein
MSKASKLNKFIEEEKQARTIRVKSLVIGIVFTLALMGSFIGGWIVRSNFESEVASRVDYRLEQRELVSKEVK